jgi:hypothetical protein
VDCDTVGKAVALKMSSSGREEAGVLGVEGDRLSEPKAGEVVRETEAEVSVDTEQGGDRGADASRRDMGMDRLGKEGGTGEESIQTRIAGFPMSMPAMYDREERSPLALTLPRRGTRGTRPFWMTSTIFSTSSHLTPECPRKRELVRTSRAARVHGGGMVVE